MCIRDRSTTAIHRISSCPSSVPPTDLLAIICKPSRNLYCALIQLIVYPFADSWAGVKDMPSGRAVSYTHLRAHETPEHLVCRLLLEKKKKKIQKHAWLHHNTI
eukprot:TRINITY_DN59031_c0_g1_i1.p1 TRINITY_DN59031_c0_g1~~TRINITY_DN59031_c0_g1_i1.p1  ORF type:complete len:104 (+),score=15.31 TRINITY_DN59031_c0_g1_i1:126-437(+)